MIRQVNGRADKKMVAWLSIQKQCEKRIKTKRYDHINLGIEGQLIKLQSPGRVCDESVEKTSENAMKERTQKGEKIKPSAGWCSKG